MQGESVTDENPGDEPVRDDAPPYPQHAPHEVPRTSLIKALLGPLIFFALLALKFGKVAFVAVKGVKFFGTAASMLVSVAAYALFYGWPFAFGFVVLLFVHELGHALQLRREGVAAGAPVFIPFVGAAIVMKELPKDAAMEARVGIAGPILGSLGAGVVHLAALATDSGLLMALAFTAYFLNLFNLVPVSPLDGGRIAAALDPRLWVGGLVLLALLFFVRPNPVLLLIVLLGAWDSWTRLRSRSRDETYYRSVPPGFRAVLGATWIGLVLALVFLMQASHVPRSL